MELHLGDGLKAMAELPDKSVDFIFTDPPYGHNNNNGDLISNIEKALGKGKPGPPRPILNDGPEANDLYKTMLKEAQRVLKPGSCLCCCCSGGGGKDVQFADWSLWMHDAIGLKQAVVWDKGPIGMGWHYRRSYEFVLVGQKKGAACKWFDDSHKIENIIRHIRKIIPRADQHPTVKPVALVEFFLNLHTKPGDTILDPFMGSGTTGIAALRNGRNFVGIELDRQWYEMAIRRFEQEKHGKQGNEGSSAGADREADPSTDC